MELKGYFIFFLHGAWNSLETHLKVWKFVPPAYLKGFLYKDKKSGQNIYDYFQDTWVNFQNNSSEVPLPQLAPKSND